MGEPGEYKGSEKLKDASQQDLTEEQKRQKDLKEAQDVQKNLLSGAKDGKLKVGGQEYVLPPEKQADLAQSLSKLVESGVKNFDKNKEVGLGAQEWKRLVDAINTTAQEFLVKAETEAVTKIKAQIEEAPKNIGKIKDYLQSHTEYVTGEWRTINREIAKILGVDTQYYFSDELGDLLAKKLQDVIRKKVKDYDCKRDGQIGPVTLVGFAKVLGIENFEVKRVEKKTKSGTDVEEKIIDKNKSEEDEFYEDGYFDTPAPRTDEQVQSESAKNPDGTPIEGAMLGGVPNIDLDKERPEGFARLFEQGKLDEALDQFDGAQQAEMIAAYLESQELNEQQKIRIQQVDIYKSVLTSMVHDIEGSKTWNEGGKQLFEDDEWTDRRRESLQYVIKSLDKVLLEIEEHPEKTLDELMPRAAPEIVDDGIIFDNKTEIPMDVAGWMRVYSEINKGSSDFTWKDPTGSYLDTQLVDSRDTTYDKDGVHRGLFMDISGKFKEAKSLQELQQQYIGAVQFMRSRRDYASAQMLIEDTLLKPQFENAQKSMLEKTRNECIDRGNSQIAEKFTTEVRQQYRDQGLKTEQIEAVLKGLQEEAGKREMNKIIAKTDDGRPFVLSGADAAIQEVYRDMMGTSSKWYKMADATWDTITDECIKNAPLIILSGGAASIAVKGISAGARALLLSGRLGSTLAKAAEGANTIRAAEGIGSSISAFNSMSRSGKALYLAGRTSLMVAEGAVFETTHMGIQGEWIGDQPEWVKQILISSATLGAFHMSGSMAESASKWMGRNIKIFGNENFKKILSATFKVNVEAGTMMAISAIQHGYTNGNLKDWDFVHEYAHAMLTVGALKMSGAGIQVGKRFFTPRPKTPTPTPTPDGGGKIDGGGNELTLRGEGEVVTVGKGTEISRDRSESKGGKGEEKSSREARAKEKTSDEDTQLHTTLEALLSGGMTHDKIASLSPEFLNSLSARITGVHPDMGLALKLFSIHEQPTAASLKKAYRSIMKILHPDKLGNLSPQARANGQNLVQTVNRANDIIAQAIGNGGIRESHFADRSAERSKASDTTTTDRDETAQRRQERADTPEPLKLTDRKAEYETYRDAERNKAREEARAEEQAKLAEEQARAEAEMARTKAEIEAWKTAKKREMRDQRTQDSIDAQMETTRKEIDKVAEEMQDLLKEISEENGNYEKGKYSRLAREVVGEAYAKLRSAFEKFTRVLRTLRVYLSQGPGEKQMNVEEAMKEVNEAIAELRKAMDDVHEARKEVSEKHEAKLRISEQRRTERLAREAANRRAARRENEAAERESFEKTLTVNDGKAVQEAVQKNLQLYRLKKMHGHAGENIISGLRDAVYGFRTKMEAHIDSIKRELGEVQADMKQNVADVNLPKRVKELEAQLARAEKILDSVLEARKYEKERQGREDQLHKDIIESLYETSDSYNAKTPLYELKALYDKLSAAMKSYETNPDFSTHEHKRNFEALRGRVEALGRVINDRLIREGPGLKRSAERIAQRKVSVGEEVYVLRKDGGQMEKGWIVESIDPITGKANLTKKSERAKKPNSEPEHFWRVEEIESIDGPAKGFDLGHDVANAYRRVNEALGTEATLGTLDFRKAFETGSLKQKNVGNCYLIAALNSLGSCPHFEALVRTSYKKVSGGWEVKIPLGDRNAKAIFVAKADIQAQANKNFGKPDRGGEVDNRRMLEPVNASEGYQVLEAAFIKDKFGTVDRNASEQGFGHQALERLLGGNNFEKIKIASDVGVDSGHTVMGYNRSEHFADSPEPVKAQLAEFLDHFNAGRDIATANTRPVFGGHDSSFNIPGVNYQFAYNHAYSILRTSQRTQANPEGTVVIANPWNAGVEISLTYAQFNQVFGHVSSGRIKYENFFRRAPKKQESKAS